MASKMNTKENLPPFTPSSYQDPHEYTPPETSSGSLLGIRPWHLSAFPNHALRARSPNDKPSLQSQRDHSACQHPDTPLRVRKTRENLRSAAYPDIPPPCAHYNHSPLAKSSHGNESIQLDTQNRHVSVSRRMLSKVTRGIGNRAKIPFAIRPAESDASLFRLVSGQRKVITDVDCRSQSFDIERCAVGTFRESTPELVQQTSPGSLRFLKNNGRLRNPQDVPPDEPSTTCYNSSPSPEPTPKARKTQPPGLLEPGPPSIVCAAVPYVVVDVTVDHPVLDASLSRDVWVAIEASICTKPSTVPATDLTASSTVSDGESAFRYACGRITTLRMCYKAGASCTVTDVIGHKALKDLEPNQKCSLFIKVHVPAVSVSTTPDDQDSLFAEIESMVGSHGTQILGLEARYRHSLLPYDNVVAVRQPVKIRRPRTDLHWSMTIDEDAPKPSSIHARLADHIAQNYEPVEAAKLIDGCLTAAQLEEPEVVEVRRALESKLSRSDSGVGLLSPSQNGPMLGVYDVDADSPSLPSQQFRFPSPRPPVPPRSTSRSLLLPSNLVAAKTSASVKLDNGTSNATEDEARNLWHHLRQSSLTTKQLADLGRTPTQQAELQRIEANDQGLRELRRRALANKRSVGAETLRAWQ